MRGIAGREGLACMVLAGLVCLAGIHASPTLAQSSGKTPLAVLEFAAVGATAAEASAITERLREELIKAGRVRVVDRSQMAQILAAQADAQAGCKGADCTLKVGKILGVRLLISGKVVKFAPDAWQVSATLVDTETAETLKAETVRHRGDILTLSDQAMPSLAAKLGS